ncbi:MAG: hypothetical protein AAF389_10230 [Gemmatimonadota bacterium]
MNPRTLLSATALGLALIGFPALFVPEVVATWLELGAGATLPVQLFGGGLLSVAVLDWVGRGAIYGGIYGRPIVVANFGFAMLTSGTMLSACLDGRVSPVGWVAVGIFAAQAVGFFRLMRSPPWVPSDHTHESVGSP